MTELEKLNERITQLTELVKTGSEAIKSMETALKAAEEERDRLADQRRENEPKFERVKYGEFYHSVGYHFFSKGKMSTYKHSENHDRDDDDYFTNNNYFYTEERAREVADKINFLLKLERLHDTFCPDYKPNWKNNKLKYFIYYNNCHKQYMISTTITVEYKTDVFFATQEIAQKVCDILNAELKEENERNCNE